MKLGISFRANFIGVIVGLMGFLNIVSSAVLIGRLELLRQVMPSAITQGSRSLTLVAGFFLIAVAWNLAKRKRVAWRISVWLLVLSTFSHLFMDLDVEATLIAVFLLGVLVRFRHDFTVRSDPTAVKSLLFAAPYAVLFLLSYSILGFFVLRHEFQPAFSLESVIQETVNLATLQGSQLYTPLTLHARWFVESLTVMTSISTIYVAYYVMRHVLQPEPRSPRDWDIAKEIIHAYGSSDLVYAALGHDKSYFFNAEESCVIAYVVRSGVSLTIGDPIGPARDMESTIRAFRRFCEGNDWIPAFHSVRQAMLPVYLKEGFKVVKVGEEAYIDTATFTLTGRAKDDLRLAMNRAKREEWQLLFFDQPIEDHALVEQLREVSGDWLKEKVGGEMGFTMGQTPITGSHETRVTVAIDRNGRVLAFMTWAPMYGLSGWVGDFMRRAQNAPNGIIDFLIVSTIFAFREKGDTILSLGMAPLANVTTNDPEVTSFLERVFELIYHRVNTVYNFKSLYGFKKKFEPRWESRYLAYPSLSSFPLIMYAFVNAHLPNFSIREIRKLIRRTL